MIDDATSRQDQAPVQESFLGVQSALVQTVSKADPVWFRAPPGVPLPLGSCVEVPVARHTETGYVVAARDARAELPKHAVRAVIAAGGTTAGVLDLVAWAADYYHCRPGLFLRAVLPNRDRCDTDEAQQWEVDAPDPAGPEVSERHRAIHDAIVAAVAAAGGPLTIRDAAEAGKTSPTTLKALAGAGLLRMRKVNRAGRTELAVEAEWHQPTPAQAEVIAAIGADLDAWGGKPHLLHGVTGSGKTLVYLHLIERVIAMGRQALVLLPEISLTPQLAARFRARLGPIVVVLHSGLSDGQRAEAYRRALTGQAQVVLGARSALFAPLERIGIIIVDEEHESSYKQDAMPRYHARDLAIVYAKQRRIPVVLGSATPSLESWHHAQTGRYRIHRLTERPGNRRLPSTRIVDVRSRDGAGSTDLSGELIDGLRQARASGRQSIVLLNRRGWSPRVFCRSCGTGVQCAHCDVGMVWHQKSGQLICHFCGYRTPMLRACPACQSPCISTAGLGTESLESRIREVVPGIRTLRMDADTTNGRGSHASILAAFSRGEADCLVGTQMVAKGIDFPRVTFVGVVGADLGLNLPDFRSGERTFCLLSQVAGRAGRGDHRGTVVIQAHQPGAIPIVAAATQDLARFYDAELALRREFGYPPFGAMIRIEWSGPDEERVRQCAHRQGQALISIARQMDADALDPTLCDPAYLHGRHRWAMILKAGSRPVLQRVVSVAERQGLLTHERLVACALDVDPFQLT